ncbi:MAG: polysaccharide deacetylase [Lachnospiraceae bacterium]|nr:polysaccharide deacetylase [Lachnospiraceae bacterium]
MDQRKRVNLIKKIVMYGILIMLTAPIISAALLLIKVDRLEKKLSVIAVKKNFEQMTNEYIEKKSGVVKDENIKPSEDPSGEPSETVTDAPSTEAETTDASSEATKKQRVYLTFDDGPSINCGEILDILKEKNVKATFFCIGREQERYKEFYKRIVDEGHTLGMHSYTHEYKKVYESEEAFRADVLKLQALLKDITGVESKVYRFPGGSSTTTTKNIKTYIGVLDELGISYYDWNVFNGDAVDEIVSAKNLKKNVIDGVKKNKDCIVLMHDMQNRPNTVKALPKLIDELREMGCELLPIDDATPKIQHVKK